VIIPEYELSVTRMYMNEIIYHWNYISSYGTKIKDDTVHNALLFSDDEVLLADLEYGVQNHYILRRTLQNSLE
jgi:hypothetical protein